MKKKKIPKTEKQIKKEAEALVKLKPKVPMYTAFGDNNHAKMEAEIRVLSDNMSEDEIYGEWPMDGKDDEESAEFARENGAQNSAALYTRRWMDGEEEESPSQGWAPLAKRKK